MSTKTLSVLTSCIFLFSLCFPCWWFLLHSFNTLLFLPVVAVDLPDCFPACVHLGVGEESNLSIAHPISLSLCIFSPSHSLHLCTPLFLSSFLPSLPTSAEQHTHSPHAPPSFICQSSFLTLLVHSSLPPLPRYRSIRGSPG